MAHGLVAVLVTSCLMAACSGKLCRDLGALNMLQTSHLHRDYSEEWLGATALFQQPLDGPDGQAAQLRRQVHPLLCIQ